MSEARNALDLPGINGIEDLDGDVDALDVDLNDLTRGTVVTMDDRGDGTEAVRCVVTGRHESSGSGIDQTDLIELKALDPSEPWLSDTASVAVLHHKAARGEIKVDSGWRGIATWLLGRGRSHLRTLTGHDERSDVCNECGEPTPRSDAERDVVRASND